MTFLRRNIRIPVDLPPSRIPPLLAHLLDLPVEAIRSWEIVRKGIDARKKPRIHAVLTVRFTVDASYCRHLRQRRDPDLEPWEPPSPEVISPVSHPLPVLVVGMGPAGLFAAHRLLSYGLSVVMVERGGAVEDRAVCCTRFWREGVLDPDCNVQFGEGGAGTFSDGKLVTRVKDPRVRLVFETLVSFGAPEEILVAARPHVGTDRLRRVIRAMRDDLASRGAEIRLRCRLSDLVLDGDRVRGGVLDDREEIRSDHLLLAPGNSARDTIDMLHRRGVSLSTKPFAVGVRVEHPQELIDAIQYGRMSSPELPPADYSLAVTDSATGRGVYSFCMCPGGVVIAASSEEGGVVTNGMSFHARRGQYANSALVVTVGEEDFPGSSPLAGFQFQRVLEERAFAAGGGGYRAPAEPLLSFLGRRGGVLRSTYRPGVTEYPLESLLPPVVTDHLRRGIQSFDRRMRGFITAEATLVGVETRTSSPVRIVRDEECRSLSHRGLYPCGEGAGYAGGITSAALDGIRVADAIVASVRRGEGGV
ncbi:MAG: hypothetical protein Fur0034_13060 [Desulfuromonadia bacterium]